MVSSAAIERLYEFAPGWDKYALENMYIAWAKDKEPARNEDARFLRLGEELHEGEGGAVRIGSAGSRYMPIAV